MANPNIDNEELETLKARADLLGITYKSNVTSMWLREAIAKKMEEDEQGEKALGSISKEEAYKEAMKLVRVIVSPNDPIKHQLEGEIFTVSNSLIGSYKKYVPFNNQAGYHIPQIMVNMLQEKKAQIFPLERRNGRDVRVAKEIKAYNVQILPPLTKQELQDLAKSQQARQSIED